MWRASFVLESPDITPLIEILEADAEAVSFFEEGADDQDETLSWRIELLLRSKPAKRALTQRLEAVLNGLPPEDLQIGPVVHDDWLQSLKAPGTPLHIGRIFVHGSQWQGVVPEQARAIQIDAGMAFGSGEHATTRACLEALDWLHGRHRVRRALDLGCGSGVLAIAVAKLWRSRVLANDIDPTAVEVARANIKTNQVDLHVRAIQGDGYANPSVKRSAPFDLVVANILAQPLIDLAANLRRHLAPDGRAVLSGLLDRQVDPVLEAHRVVGLELLYRIDIAPWVALILRPRRRWRDRTRPRYPTNLP